MSQRTIKLLHVEDEVLQQRVIAHHLGALAEFAFDTVAVESENQAMAAFQREKFELVILDYQLAQGDGLHLLSRLRQLDPIIPIVAISGVATAEVAADLVNAGADDYFDKRQLDSNKLARSIRAILQRADTLSKRTSKSANAISRIEEQVTVLCRSYVVRMGTRPLEEFAGVESAIRNAQIGAVEIELLYGTMCGWVEAENKVDSASARLLLRPVFLELLFRFGAAAEEEAGEVEGREQPLAG